MEYRTVETTVEFVAQFETTRTGEAFAGHIDAATVFAGEQ